MVGCANSFLLDASGHCLRNVLRLSSLMQSFFRSGLAMAGIIRLPCEPQDLPRGQPETFPSFSAGGAGIWIDFAWADAGTF